jgi:hypothetical protein
MRTYEINRARGPQKWPVSKTIFVATDHPLPDRAGANNFIVGEMIVAPLPPCLSSNAE